MTTGANMTHPKPSDAALALIKGFEQSNHFAPTIYRCPAGYRTIGWGHRVQAGEKFNQPINAAEAEELLRADVLTVGNKVSKSVKVELTQSMMDALTSFTYNVGIGAFFGSTLLDRLNAGDYRMAASEFMRWDKFRDPKTGEKTKLPGLTRRRQAERELFLRDGIPG